MKINSYNQVFDINQKQIQKNVSIPFGKGLSLDSVELLSVKKEKKTSFVSKLADMSLQIMKEKEFIKILLDSHIITKDLIPKYKETIKTIAKENFENASQNCAILKDAASKGLLSITEKRSSIWFDQVSDILLNKKMTPNVVKAIVAINSSRAGKAAKTNDMYFNCPIYKFEEASRLYENLDIVSTVDQKKLTDIVSFCDFLTDEEIKNLPSTSDFMNIDLIKDCKELGIEKVLDKISKNRTHSLVSPINVEQTVVNDFEKILNPEHFKDALVSTDLLKYQKGFPMKYSRKEFITDFKKIVNDLSESNKKAVYSHFGFFIDKDDDIIHYPHPNLPIDESLPDNLKSTIEKANVIVSSYMLNNEVALENGDKELEKVVNDMLKIFPEFVPLIGKIQHRGDSIDFHTFDDLKKVMTDSRYDSLSDNDKQVLNFAILFHDYSKPQGKVDKEHPITSSYYAKDIIKKLPISKDDKERIVNLIKYSHWNTSGLSKEDLALAFRRPNDFKLAQMLALADGKSAGFNPSVEKLKDEGIQKNIDTINSSALALFPNTIPTKLTNLEVAPDGTEYLDFSDINADITKYGFKEGTKVKDLNFFFHSSSDTCSNFSLLCDDTESIALSTVFLPFYQASAASYNYSPVTYVINSPNANIIAAGRTIGGTGTKKDSEYFKQMVFPSYKQKVESQIKQNENVQKVNPLHRTNFSTQVKDYLNIGDAEYTELYGYIQELSSISEVKDIELSSGKKLKAEDVISIFDKLRTDMLDSPLLSTYKNEAVIYKPKIDAFVISKEKFFSEPEYSQCGEQIQEAKKLSKEYNIPIILR